jgi:hypothetical protein
MREIRAVVNQCGVAMELHGHTEKPIMLDLIGWAELGAFRAELAKSNPDFRHAVIGQLAIMYANRIYPHAARVDVTVNQSPWTYNASSDTYERAA